MLAGKEFKVAHGTQLNNAEWSPLFVACLLYLHTQQAGSLIGVGLSLFSVCGYCFVKLFFQGKPAPICGLGRYVALGWLIFEVAATGM